ncbi:MAG TPA: hypothetical protein PLP33_25255 [Leptospiraceae bacterium]|nr:hypothetical protein [Leptospiraceae bacterium]
MTTEEIDELIPYGYAPGLYYIPKCKVCELQFSGDKRATVCKGCAEKAKADCESRLKLHKKER